MNKKIKLAVVGATGVVGRKFLEVLEEENLNIDEYKLFASKRSANKKVSFFNKKYKINELTEKSFDEGFDYALFSAGGDIALKYVPIATEKECIVIDNSSAFRMDFSVPLVVPEVNAKSIRKIDKIISNPNCSTIQAILPLKILDDNYKIKRIVYSTYQAVSGAGIKGIRDLENGRKGIKSLEKFPHQIYNNCLPHIDVFLDNGYTKEEDKMINETRKILDNPTLPITATAVRVPVLNSHSESINVEFEKDFEIEDVIDLLSNSKGIIVQDDISKNIYPLATNVTGHNEVYVGRIRRDFSVKSGLNLWVVADNIRKGAATNAVQILKYLIQGRI